MAGGSVLRSTEGGTMSLKQDAVAYELVAATIKKRAAALQRLRVFQAAIGRKIAAVVNGITFVEPGRVEATMKVRRVSSKATTTKAMQVRKDLAMARSEERRVGKECRSRWSP